MKLNIRLSDWETSLSASLRQRQIQTTQSTFLNNTEESQVSTADYIYCASTSILTQTSDLLRPPVLYAN